jgi:hypothetical protein
MALYYLKKSGEFDAAVREWEQKATVDKAWANIKMFMATEYVKENKQNNLRAKQFQANIIEERAEATEELIANLTEALMRQMETLIKSTINAMKEMLTLMKTNVTPNPTNQTNEEKKKKMRRNKRNIVRCQNAMHQRKKTNAGN